MQLWNIFVFVLMIFLILFPYRMRRRGETVLQLLEHDIWILLSWIQGSYHWICRLVGRLLKSFRSLILNLIFTRYGQLTVVLLAGWLRYVAPWEAYNPILAPGGYVRSLGPGEDQRAIAQLVQNMFLDPNAPIVVCLFLLAFILPRQSLRRDKLVRWFHGLKIFGTYRRALEFVKTCSWLAILCLILYIGVR